MERQPGTFAVSLVTVSLVAVSLVALSLEGLKLVTLAAWFDLMMLELIEQQPVGFVQDLVGR